VHLGTGQGCKISGFSQSQVIDIEAILQLQTADRICMPKKAKAALDGAKFASNQLELLEKERLSEVAEVSDAITLYSPSQLQARGHALLNLTISSVRTGLGGKMYCTHLRSLTI
jgi:hypothetical protein